MRLILKTNSNASRASSGWKHQFRATQKAENKTSTDGNLSVPYFASLSADWRDKSTETFGPAVYFSLARIFRHASQKVLSLVSTISFTILSMLIAYHRARIVVLKFHGWQNASDKNAGIANARYIVHTYTCMYVSCVPRAWERNQVVLEVCSIKYLPIL